jgi:UDP-N-acetylmuramoylalanine--D-glutamate ligase
MPALDELSNIKPDDIVVYEMSSFQLFDVKSSPHVAVCLMVTEDHLDWHKDLEEYYSAKSNIFKFQKPQDIAVYFSDDEISSRLSLNSGASNKYSYGDNADVSFNDDKITAFGQEVIKVSEVGLPGPHNLQNICAAICAVWPYTTDINVIAESIKGFKGLPYHIEFIADKNNVKFYNDSFSTNPTSAIAAVKSFDKPMVLYFGGYDKNADFTELAEVLKNRQVRKVMAYGQTGQKIYDTLTKLGVNDAEYSNESFEKVIKRGIEASRPGDIVLFSPACASMDMFTDYKARGQQFNNIVESL